MVNWQPQRPRKAPIDQADSKIEKAGSWLVCVGPGVGCGGGEGHGGAKSFFQAPWFDKVAIDDVSQEAVPPDPLNKNAEDPNKQLKSDGEGFTNELEGDGNVNNKKPPPKPNTQRLFLHMAAGGTEQLAGNIKVFLSDIDPKIKFPCYAALGSEVTIIKMSPPRIGIIKSYAFKNNDSFPVFPGYMVYKKNQMAHPTQPGTRLTCHAIQKMLKAPTGHSSCMLGLTNQMQEQTGAVRIRLNSKKGQFDKEESLSIWEKVQMCFRIMRKATMLLWTTCGLWRTSHATTTLALDQKFNPKNNRDWNRMVIHSQQRSDAASKRAHKTLYTFSPREPPKHFHPGIFPAYEAIIVKEQLANLYYSTNFNDTGFCPTDKRFPVMGDCYTKHIDEVQTEGLNPFLTILKQDMTLMNMVRRRLNSRKGRFEEEEASLIWKKGLDYTHYKLVLDHDKGDTYTTDHIWGMGIILLYLLCGYPSLNRKADIHCSNSIDIGIFKNKTEWNRMDIFSCNGMMPADTASEKAH
eukprot:jgi/Psemu1/7598/gm1.7598_g